MPHTATFLAARCLSPEVRELWFAAASFAFTAGQHVVLPDVDPEGPCFFSICSAPSQAPEFAFCVKDNATAATRRLFSLEREQPVSLEGPFGELVLPDPPSSNEGARPLLLVATGTGIAPFRAMAEQLERWSEYAPVSLIYGVREAQHLLYHDDWLALARRRHRFRYLPTLSRTSGDRQTKRGRVSAWLPLALADLRSADRGTSPPLALLCGLPQMVNEVRQQLISLGLPPTVVRSEA